MRRSSHLVVANVTSYPSSRGVVALFLAGCISLACGSADEGPSSSLTGKLAVYESSFKDGSSTLDYGLRREGLPEVRIELANPPRYAPGTPIKVSGQFDESGRFVASSLERSVDAAPVGTRSEALTAPTQTRSVAILLVRPSNEPEPPPFVVGKELVMNNLFGTESLPDFPAKTQNVDAYYREVSYGARALQGTVFDWMTIDPLADNCDTNALKSAALAQASANGIDLSPFQHVGIVVAASCANLAGRADLGTPSAPGRYSWYWFEAGSELFIHELGHNFGFQHSLLYDCTSADGQPVPLATTDHCTENPDFPQDPWDPMGFRSFAHFGSYNKMLQGWLAGTNVLTAGPSGGDFTLEPLELGTSAPQLLRVPADPSLCPADIRPCFYYVEYRQPIGFDSGPQFTNSGMHQGALLRLGGEIDASGNSIGNLTRLFKLRQPNPDTLRVGETFQDPTGLQITTLATPTSGDHKQLVVRVGRASRVTASFSFSSGQSGTTGSYCGDVKITNTSATPVNGGWLVRLNLNQSALTSGWNGTFTPVGGALYDLTPVSWNSAIQPGQFVTASLCANKTGASFTPEVVFTQSN
jgi:hypothetical protein